MAFLTVLVFVHGHPQAMRNSEGTGRVGCGRAEGVNILADTRAGNHRSQTPQALFCFNS